MKPKRVRILTEHDREIKRQSERRIRAARKAQGLCVRCGKVALTDRDQWTDQMVTRTMCAFHLEHEAERSTRDRDRKFDARCKGDSGAKQAGR